ncbi:MAG: hypothetical protein KDB14_02015 [Planctomycetales bacterium]|nr:hypothetical protein [Planctomycetales bacterium]
MDAHAPTATRPTLLAKRAEPCVVAMLALAAVALSSGCHLHQTPSGGPGKLSQLLHPHRNPVYLENPLFVPECDREFVWQQLVDSVDNYFKIAREERMQVIGNVVTRGEIATYPVAAATLLEPWRGDAVGFMSRLTGTLQTQRKQATVFVTPITGGYQVQVQVLVQQEDVDRPEGATVGGSSLRHDGTIARLNQDRDQDALPVTLGWIDVGHDVQLEQKILADIRDRLNVAWQNAPAVTGP